MSITGDAERANLPAVPFSTGGAAFAPDGQRLVASTVDGSATVWDSRDGQGATDVRPRTARRSTPPARTSSRPTRPTPSGADILAIDVSPDGA